MPAHTTDETNTRSASRARTAASSATTGHGAGSLTVKDPSAFVSLLGRGVGRHRLWLRHGPATSSAMSNRSSLFAGRLGLAGARVPHVDRHGLLWLSRGNLRRGWNAPFPCVGSDDVASGDYAIPYQMISMILIGHATVTRRPSHTGASRALLAAIGEGGVKLYCPPMGQRRSDVAGAHAPVGR